MKLTILGASTPYPRPGHPCSGYLVQHGSTSIWVDAGTGTLAELQRHIGLDELDAIWISHGHADHTADLLTAYYALRFAELTIAKPIPLIGPAGLVDQLVGFLGHRSAAVIPEVFDIVEMRNWGDRQIGDLSLAWSPVDHGMPGFGLRVEADGAVLAYSGDTGPCESLIELAENADLLLAEVGVSSAQETPVHCTPEDAGRTAMTAGARRLVLTHIGSEMTPDDAVARASTLYEGELSVAQTGLVFDVVALTG